MPDWEAPVARAGCEADAHLLEVQGMIRRAIRLGLIHVTALRGGGIRIVPRGDGL
jgi:hypothetical protein